jgi:hypothetical protein
MVVAELKQTMLLGTNFFSLTDATIGFSAEVVNIRRFG